MLHFIMLLSDHPLVLQLAGPIEARKYPIRISLLSLPLSLCCSNSGDNDNNEEVEEKSEEKEREEISPMKSILYLSSIIIDILGKFMVSYFFL